MEQTRNQKPEPNSPLHSHFSYNGVKRIQHGKNSLFNKWCRGNWTSTCKRMKLDLSYTTHKSKLKMNQGFECKGHLVLTWENRNLLTLCQSKEIADL